MGHSKHVGRVGALAVALGIGSAISLHPGVAWAEPISGTSAAPSGPSMGAPNATGSASKPSSTPKPSSTSKPTSPPKPETSTTPSASDPDDEDTDPADDVDTDDPAVKPTQVKKTTGSDHPSSKQDTPGTVKKVKPTSTVSASGVSRSAATDSAHTPKPTPKPSPQRSASTPAPAAAPAVSPAATARTLSAAPATPPAPAAPTAQPALITAVLNALAAPFGAVDGPTGPTDSPALWVLLAAVRREFGQSTSERDAIPVAAPTLTSQPLQSNSTTARAAAAAANQPPTAVNDGPFTTAEDTPRVFTPAELVGNDTDPDGNTLAVNSVGSAVNGTVVLNANGSVTFTPTANYNGSASYNYRVKDSTGTTSANVATVSITVTPVNDAPVGVNDSFAIPKNSPRTFTAAELVGNDIDPDGGTLSVNSVGGPSNGSVKLNADGTVTFTPTANFTGPASFIYRVKDSTGATSTTATDATVSLTVGSTTPVNQAPTAVNDTATIGKNTTKTFTVAELVGNDTDPNSGDALAVNNVGSAVNGTVALNANGTVTFTPTANFAGTASFNYRVKDAAGAVSANVAKVTITVTGTAPVNQAPTAVNDSATISNSGPRTFTAAELVGNDTDPDTGDTLSVKAVGTAVNGTVVLNANGTVTFTPTANFIGAASFNYRVKDAAGAQSANVAKVSITVTGTTVDPAPTAVNDNGGTTNEDTPKTFTAAQLVGNDTDPDGGILSVASVSGATNGAVVLNADGTVKFTPNANYNGAASFTYKVKDAAGNISANSATVSVTVAPVNDPPVGVNDGPFTVVRNTPITFTAAQLVGNDTDPDGGTLSVNSVGGPSNGSVVLNADGTVTFTPTANYTGAASFIYRVKDASGATSTSATDATVSLTVTTGSVGVAPTAVNDNGGTTNEDTPKTFTAAQLVGNDTDPDGGTLSVASVSGATNGNVVLNADGSVKFTPNANYNGAASFTYKVKDAAGNISANSATVSVTVAPVNDAPVANNDGPYNVVKNTPLTLTAAQLVGNDTDVDGGTLTVASLGGGNHVAVTLNANGTVTVTPETGYTGAASFIYRVQDSAGATSAATGDATVTLNIQADPAAGTLTVLEPVTDNYKDSFNDPDNVRENRTYLQIGAVKAANGVTYTMINPPPNGSIQTGFSSIAVQGSDGSTGTVTLVPANPNTVASLRKDYVTSYHPAGSFGPLVVVNSPDFQTTPVSIDLVLKVNNVEVGRTTLQYKYDVALYNAPQSSIEYNGPGGQWYVAGVAAPLNWQTAGAP